MSNEKLWGGGGGGGWVVLDYNVSSGPFLSNEIGDGPGPELGNKSQVLCFHKFIDQR